MPIEKINEIRALNTTDRSIAPGLHDGYANGSRPVEANHTGEKSADPKYEHWCRPEPTKEFPWKSADVERAREKQGGMQEDTNLPRNDVGAVKGSQNPVTKHVGPHYQETGWGEWGNQGGSSGEAGGFSQWDKEQEHTYSRSERSEPYDD